LNIPIDVKKKCAEMSRQGKTAREVYTEYYSQLPCNNFSDYKSFGRMLRKWKNKVEADDVLLEAGNLGYNYTPTRTTVQVDRNGQVVQAWIKSHTNDDIYLELIENIKHLPEFEPVKRQQSIRTNRMLEIPYDDMHMGIATFKDYEQTLKDTIEIIEERPCKTIFIPIGPDLLHTNDMRGHTNKGTYIGEIDVVQAYNDTLKFYFALLETALQNSSEVHVIYLPGNHSECLSWTIVQVLKVKFPQCIYDDDPEEERKVIVYEKVFIGLTHGEELKGTLKDIKDLFVEEHPIEYCNAVVKEIHTSHLHTEKDTGDLNGCVVRRLSTRVPTDKWHKKHGYTCNNKRFMIFEYTSDRLKAVYYV
jgi:hypothetical protein